MVTAERHLSVLGNIFLGTTKLPVLAFLPRFGSLLGWRDFTSECSAASPSLQTSFYGNHRQNSILGAGKLKPCSLLPTPTLVLQKTKVRYNEEGNLV